MTMTGTAVGQMAVAVRFTTTTMFTCPIRRSHHAATILQDLRLQTVLVESAGRVELVAQGVSADPGESVDPGGSADPGGSVDRGELAGVLDQPLSAERVTPTGWQDHLLGHTIQPRRRSTRQIIRT